MHLKRLELFGFKTFHKKTVLNFPSGFLAVVGPNGSGKSNLTDAIRFCLGESNTKALRAKRLDELIFAGTPQRSPASYTEITATFDNSDGHLPIELSEIAITRTLKRDGGSSFKLNGTSCRLKDIHELLMGSGIGPGSFSVLGNKEVEQVLSSDPMERRAMVEETAGVNRYKYRKKEAERKLSQTHDNLVRLNDIKQEVETQLEEARKQLNRFERYQQCQQELKEIQKQLLQSQQLVLQQKLEQTEREWQEHQHSQESFQQTLETQHKELSTHRYQHEKLIEKKQALQEEIAQMRETCGGDRARSESMAFRCQDLEKALTRVQQRCQTHLENREQIEQELSPLPQKIALLQEQRQDAQEQMTLAEVTLKELAGEQQSQQEFFQRLQTIDQELAQTSSQQARQESQIQANRDRLEQIQKEQQDLELSTQEVSGDEQPPDLEGMETAIQTLQEQITTSLSHYTEQQKELQKVLAKEQEIQKQQRQRQYKILEKSAILEEGHDFPPTVRQVLKWNLPGTVGTIGQLIQVPEGLEAAYEAALGGRIFDIITRDRHVAGELIRQLKAKKAGRATFWPLDLNRRAPTLPPLPHRRGVVGEALKLLKFDAELLPVLQEMLGRTLILEDMPVATALFQACRNGKPHIVTREGEYLSPSGALTGGARRKSKAGLLSSRRELETLESEERLAQRQIAILHKREHELQQQLQEGEKKSLALRAQLQEEQDRYQSLKSQHQHLYQERERLRSKKNHLSQLQNELLEQQKKLQIDLEQTQEKGALLQSQRQETVAQQSQMVDQQDQNRQQREEAQKTYFELKLIYHQAQEKLNDQQLKAERLEQRKQDLNNNLGQDQLEQKQLQQQLQDLQEEHRQLELNLSRHEDQNQEHRDAMQQINESLKQAHQLQEKLEKDLVQLQLEQQKFQQKREKLQVLLATQKVQARDLKEQMLELKIEEDPQAEQLSEKEQRELAQRREKLQKFLASFGSVNLGARQEFDRLKERDDHLQEQLTDLLEGAESLRTIMDQMDQATIVQFQHTLELVQRAFAKTFTELFGGGQAHLELSIPGDYLQSGVEIIACPPGKRRQNLSLLSSGEKALCAIAFLLALLDTKPSPIIILDELDAPLDEKNVEKVATRLLEFSSSSQFLVVTHNRKTMEFADLLYGVTMQEPGTSKIVHIELQELEEQAQIS